MKKRYKISKKILKIQAVLLALAAVCTLVPQYVGLPFRLETAMRLTGIILLVVNLYLLYYDRLRVK